ncbi:MAG: enoyl-CoA hydratase/isomerase family protein [Vicinamibacterales bacterium]
MDDSLPVLLVDDPRPGVVRVVLNRPEARNALNSALIDALARALAVQAARTDLRALVLTGNGPAFCAGADLRERLTLSPQARGAHTRAINAIADTLGGFPVPTIAAVGGFALAGGGELAIACDLRVASREAVFGFPEVAIGIFPGAGAPVRLPSLIGPAAARELLYTGRRVPAVEAERLGLVNRVVEDAELPVAALELASAMAKNAPRAIRALKAALTDSDGLPAGEAHAAVARHRAPLDASEEYAEGLAAFSERRPPRF